MANTKIVRKLSPCSAYDIAATEQWLEEMAAKGYHLSAEKGFVLGLGRFEVGEPKTVKYRLEAASAKMALFEVFHMNTDVTPDGEALQLHEEMGWEYVTNRLAFHVFRSTREDAREPHTDPKTQAEGLKSAGLRLLYLLIGVILLNALFGVQWFLQSFNFGMGPYGGLFSLVTILLNLWTDAEVLNRLVRYLVLRRKVKQGQDLRSRKRRRSTLPVRLAALALLFLGYLILLFANALLAGAVPTEDYSAPIPFLTLSEAFPDGVELEEDVPRWFSNEAETGSTLLAGENLKWTESMLLQMPDGAELSANLSVEYHLARTEGIAQWMVTQQTALIEDLPYGVWALDAPDADVDAILLYGSEVGGPQLILRQGRHVIVASVGYSGIADTPGYLDAQRWAAEMAEALLAYVGEGT